MEILIIILYLLLGIATLTWYAKTTFTKNDIIENGWIVILISPLYLLFKIYIYLIIKYANYMKGE